jgi:hypothetical protein
MTVALLPDLQGLVKLLHADLIERSQERDDVAAHLRALHADRQKQHRSAQSYEEWREEFLTQVSAAWVLACVFVRYLEDNRFLREFHLAGPDSDALRQAKDRFDAYMRGHPDDSERNYLLDLFQRMQRIKAVKDLFAPGKTALWAVEPSNAGAMKLLEFWQDIDETSGEVKRRFESARGDTRFLGDLYQDLSEETREKYALYQTPEFIEEFILDRTLEPAIAEFGFEDVRLIDPTCGSGHFLLGAFARLFPRWEQIWQETGDIKDTNRIDLVQRALNQVYGVDLNPYAVAICRFRLMIAALHACEMCDLEQAPGWKVNVAVGDSLFHGYRFDAEGERIPRQWVFTNEESREWDDPYDLEDLREVNRILAQQFHVVVGNPPYITAKDRVVSKLYRETYSTCYKKYHLSSPFTERFFGLTLATRNGDPPGYTGLIIDNAFMKRDFGIALVKYLKGVDLTHVVNTDNVPLPGHGTPTVILCGRNRRPIEPIIRAVLGIKGEFPQPEDPSESKVWRSIIEMLHHPGTQNEFITVMDMERSRLAEWPWSMGGGGTAELKDFLDASAVKRLAECVDAIGVFGMTNADEVYIADKQSFARRGVEMEFVLQLQLGDEIRDWGTTEGNYAIFPYRADGKLVELRDAPFMHRWLWPTRTTLGNRATFDKGTYFSEGLPWWKWHQVAPERLKPNLTISLAFVATNNHFVLDRGGKVYNRSAPIIKLHASAGEAEHHSLLSFLNSSVAGFWMRQVFFPKGGDQVGNKKARVRRTWWEERFEYAANGMSDFPIPKDTPGTLAQRLDSLAQKYTALHPARVVQQVLPTRGVLDEACEKAESLRQRMITLQEELDWQAYRLYGLTPEPMTYSGDVPPLNLGERAFEFIMARKIARKELETAWFERHGSTPITELPAHWPTEYRNLVERRIRLIETNKDIGLMEQPEYKRRWSLEKPKKTCARSVAPRTRSAAGSS